MGYQRPPTPSNRTPPGLGFWVGNQRPLTPSNLRGGISYHGE